MHRLLVAGALGLSSLSCGDGSDDAADSSEAGSLSACGVRVVLAGAATATFVGRNDAACGSQHSFDSGIDVAFIKVDDDSPSFDLSVGDVTEAATGAEFSAHVSLRLQDGRRWSSALCSVTIDEHRLLETELSELGELRHYQLTGTGSCSAGLEPASADADGDVTLGDFAFRIQVTWRD